MIIHFFRFYQSVVDADQPDELKEYIEQWTALDLQDDTLFYNIETSFNSGNYTSFIGREQFFEDVEAQLNNIRKKGSESPDAESSDTFTPDVPQKTRAVVYSTVSGAGKTSAMLHCPNIRYLGGNNNFAFTQLEIDFATQCLEHCRQVIYRRLLLLEAVYANNPDSCTITPRAKLLEEVPMFGTKLLLNELSDFLSQGHDVTRVLGIDEVQMLDTHKVHGEDAGLGRVFVRVLRELQCRAYTEFKGARLLPLATGIVPGFENNPTTGKNLALYGGDRVVVKRTHFKQLAKLKLGNIPMHLRNYSQKYQVEVLTAIHWPRVRDLDTYVPEGGPSRCQWETLMKSYICDSPINASDWAELFREHCALPAFEMTEQGVKVLPEPRFASDIAEAVGRYVEKDTKGDWPRLVKRLPKVTTERMVKFTAQGFEENGFHILCSYFFLHSLLNSSFPPLFAWPSMGPIFGAGCDAACTCDIAAHTDAYYPFTGQKKEDIHSQFCRNFQKSRSEWYFVATGVQCPFDYLFVLRSPEGRSSEQGQSYLFFGDAKSTAGGLNFGSDIKSVLEGICSFVRILQAKNLLGNDHVVIQPFMLSVNGLTQDQYDSSKRCCESSGLRPLVVLMAEKKSGRVGEVFDFLPWTPLLFLSSSWCESEKHQLS